MISLPDTPEETVVFTADFAGVYAFVLSPVSVAYGHPLYLNGEQANGTASPGLGGQSSFVLYLAAADEISYLGPPADLYGFRIGDEL